MKKNILFFLLLTMSVTSFCQQTNPAPTLIKQDYLKKSRNQKTAAWCLLGGGVFAFGLGSIQPDFLKGAEKSGAPQIMVMLTGMVSMGVSVPFFISAAKNKKKAMSLSFKNETLPQIYKSRLVYNNIPSLTLKINL